jgi:hypothetical protein
MRLGTMRIILGGFSYNLSFFCTGEGHAIRLQFDDGARSLFTHVLDGFLSAKKIEAEVVDGTGNDG